MKLRRNIIFMFAAVILTGCATYDPPIVRRRPMVPSELRKPVPRRTSAPTSATKPSTEALPQSLENVKQATAEKHVDLAHVLDAVENQFPGLHAAKLEIAAAEARLLSAEGRFDTLVTLETKNKVEGYYENNNLNFNITQPLETWGAKVKSGYRYALGDFGSYDGDIDTNAGGEFFFGFEVPLLKGNAIDSRRAELWKRRIELDRADPIVREERVRLYRKATESYWKCVAAAQKIKIAQDLLELAETRRTSLRDLVAEGQLPEIYLTDNERLFVARQAKLIQAKRTFEKATIGLSIYYRDNEGNPVRLTIDRIPRFPKLPDIFSESLENHVTFGIANRPEMRGFLCDLAAADLDLFKRNNDMLPKFDAFVTASQDIGRSTSADSSDDPFEFGIGIKFEMPLARRVARGKLRQSQIKMSQLTQKARLTADKIEAEIRDAASALSRARENLLLYERSVELAQTLERAEQDKLLEGASDLLRVNLREQSTAKARVTTAEAYASCFVAFANYLAAMGLPRLQSDE